MLAGPCAPVRHKKWMPALYLVAGIAFFSCHKKDIAAVDEADKLYVRILQVAKDGTERASKVVQVTAE